MNRFFKIVLLTGLFVGTTDLLYAFTMQWINSGKFADWMFRGIASVAVGKSVAFPGNDWIAALGLFFHYFIAMAWTFFFFWIFPKVKFLRFNKYLIGILYGIFVNVVFEQVILPFFMPRFAFSLPKAYINWICFGILFGIPIAYNAYKYYNIKDE